MFQNGTIVSHLERENFFSIMTLYKILRNSKYPGNSAIFAWPINATVRQTYSLKQYAAGNLSRNISTMAINLKIAVQVGHG